MQQENLLERIQKLPQGQAEFVLDNDPILLHLNEVAALNRGISRQKSALSTYETSATQLSEALLQYRNHKIGREALEKIINSAMASFEDNLADDFYFGTVKRSGSAQQRILLAHQIGLVSEDHLDWSKVITEQRTNVLNIFIFIVKDLQRNGLDLEPLTLEDSAETFTNRFEQLIELLQKIDNYITCSTSSVNGDVLDLEKALSSAINTVYESWLKPLIVVPRFYEALLMKHALSRLLNQANADLQRSSGEFVAAQIFAEKHGYIYDSRLGVFRSKLPKRAT